MAKKKEKWVHRVWNYNIHHGWIHKDFEDCLEAIQMHRDMDKVCLFFGWPRPFTFGPVKPEKNPKIPKHLMDQLEF